MRVVCPKVLLCKSVNYFRIPAKDAEKANALLDEIGLQWDKDHEYRLRSDGKRLAIRIEVSDVRRESPVELVTEYFREIGVDLQMKAVDRNLKLSHFKTNEFDAHMRLYGMLDRAFIVRPMDFIQDTQ